MVRRRIGIDARPLEENPTGIGRIVLGSVNGILEGDASVELVLFSNKEINRQIFVCPDRVTCVRVGLNKHLFDLLVGFSARRERLDVYYGTNQSLPLFGVQKKVLLICDMSAFRFPHLHSTKWRIYLQASIWISSKLASKIITISQSSRRDIVHFLGKSEEDVEIVYPWLEKRGDEIAVSRDLWTSKYPFLSKRFILCVGTLKKRKNIDNLFRAFRILVEANKRDLLLVLAGRVSKGVEAVDFSGVQDLLGTRIHVLGYVEEAELQSLYRNSEIVVYLSTYEGFGLPIFEAMTAGKPIVVSDIPVHREVLGDAGLLVQPSDPDEIADAMERVVVDESFRLKLIEQGFRRLSEFKRDKSLSLLRHVLLC
jgi:glycosyltransferase involved in cell wall biosynthesis